MMGSAEVSETPHGQMEKKNIIQKLFSKVSSKIAGKTKKHRDEEKKDATKGADSLISGLQTLDLNTEDVKPKVTAEVLLAGLNKLSLDNEQKEEDTESETEVKDEFDHFDYKTIEEDPRIDRIGSHSSEDSGFVEPKDDNEDEDKKKEEVKEKKSEKKEKIVKVRRGPIRNKNDHLPNYPYNRETQVTNKQTLSGGVVIQQTTQNDFNNDFLSDDVLNQIIDNMGPLEPKDFDILTNICQQNSDMSPQVDYILPESSEYTAFLQTEELLHDAIPRNEALQDILRDLEQAAIPPSTPETYDQLADFIHDQPLYPTPESTPSPMSYHQSTASPGSNVLSPESYCLSSESNYLSPERYSPIDNHLETFQELPVCVEEFARERTCSTNSSTKMKLKNFKDRMKELGNEFSKDECCQTNKQTCEELFKTYFDKFSTADKRKMCIKVAQINIDEAPKALHHMILALAGGEEVDLHMVLFRLVCDRLLGTKPEVFLDKTGLALLCAATLRCHTRPLLARQLVACVYAALKITGRTLPEDQCVFTETDAEGNTLLQACARAGDACSAVLAALTARPDGPDTPAAPPLFPLEHTNTNGYTALHIAAMQHTAKSPCLRVIHVLLEHAKADVVHGDELSGNTALHSAVNSPGCDLDLVLVMFRAAPRAAWHALARSQNRSNSTPLEYARAASRSSTRQNFPLEVIDFLNKCRNSAPRPSN